MTSSQRGLPSVRNVVRCAVRTQRTCIVGRESKRHDSRLAAGRRWALRVRRTRARLTLTTSTSTSAADTLYTRRKHPAGLAHLFCNIASTRTHHVRYLAIEIQWMNIHFFRFLSSRWTADGKRRTAQERDMKYSWNWRTSNGMATHLEAYIRGSTL